VVNATGLERGLSKRMVKRISPFALATTAVSASVAVLHCDLVIGQMCSCHGILWSFEGLENRTANVVALCVANGDEDYDT